MCQLAIKKERLSEDGAKARAEYYRQYRLKHPDRVKATQNRYWNKKAKQLASDQRREEQNG